MGWNPGLAFYRRMIKALRLKFEGDSKTYGQFKYAIKMETLSHKEEKDQVKLSKMIYDFDVAREWLLKDVMRADLQEDGKYKLRVNKEQLQGTEVKPVKNPHYFEFDLPPELIQNAN